MKRLLGMVLALASLAVAGCGSPCGADNCAGCCDATGACVASNTDHCGANGAACQACGVNACSDGLCINRSAGPTSTGGGGGATSSSSATTSSSSSSGSSGSSGSTSTVSSSGGSTGSRGTASSSSSSGGSTGSGACGAPDSQGSCSYGDYCTTFAGGTCQPAVQCARAYQTTITDGQSPVIYDVQVIDSGADPTGSGNCATNVVDTFEGHFYDPQGDVSSANAYASIYVLGDTGFIGSTEGGNTYYATAIDRASGTFQFQLCSDADSYTFGVSLRDAAGHDSNAACLPSF